LSSADALLRAQELVSPPDGLAERVQAALDVEAARPPAWKRHAAEAALVVTGGMVLISGLISIVMAWGRVLGGEAFISLVSGVVSGASALSVEAATLVDTSLLMWPLYGFLAVTMTIFWFGAIVVPLHARRVRSSA
jgi:hypothetical protein